MSENKAKTPAEQAVAAQVATPEPVEEQAVQAESAAADTADQPAAPAEREEAPQEVAPGPVIVVTAPQGLNLRKGPHISYGVMTVLPDGAAVEILDLPLDVEVPGWALVKTGAGTGWVNTTFLTEAEA